MRSKILSTAVLIAILCAKEIFSQVSVAPPPSMSDQAALYNQGIQQFTDIELAKALSSFSLIAEDSTALLSLRCAALNMLIECLVRQGEYDKAREKCIQLSNLINEAEQIEPKKELGNFVSGLRLRCLLLSAQMAEYQGDIKAASADLKRAWECWSHMPAVVRASDQVRKCFSASSILHEQVRLLFRQRMFKDAAMCAQTFIEQFPQKDSYFALMVFRLRILEILVREPGLAYACDPASVFGSLPRILRPADPVTRKTLREQQQQQLDIFTREVESLLKESLPTEQAVFIRYHLAWILKEWGKSDAAIEHLTVILDATDVDSATDITTDLVRRARVEMSQLLRNRGDIEKSKMVIAPLLSDPAVASTPVGEVASQIQKLLDADTIRVQQTREEGVEELK